MSRNRCAAMAGTILNPLAPESEAELISTTECFPLDCGRAVPSLGSSGSA